MIFSSTESADTADTQHQEQSQRDSNGIKILPNPIQAKADWRSYRCLQLPNGVTVALVHDPASKTTAAAATVAAGASSDPRESSGLAHFVEHACFLGSEKYPLENEYKQYLSRHGGRSNASTSLYLTTYKFDVLSQHAEHALDLFGQFFVAPLFTASATAREVQAVDSEDSKNRVADNRRRLQVLKHVTSLQHTGTQAQHYFNKFTTGNYLTLPSRNEEEIARLRAQVKAFHALHYQPSNLTVAVCGPQTLDTLQSWVVPLFGAMQARELEANRTVEQEGVFAAARDAPVLRPDVTQDCPILNPEDAYWKTIGGNSSESDSSTIATDTKAWPLLVTLQPIRSMRRLALQFPVPPVPNDKLDQSPVNLLSHLLGHEGPGSAFAVLQNEGWISSLSAGSRTSGPDFHLFQVEVQLTETGEAEWQKVAHALLDHCRLIAAQAQLALETDENETRQEWQRLWSEMAQLRAIQFHQSSPGAAYSLVPGLSQDLVYYDTKHVLSVGCMLHETPETLPLKAVAAYASRLVPSNCLLERCSKDAWSQAQQAEEAFSSSSIEKLTEPWYGVEYYLQRVDMETTTAWTKPSAAYESLHLPHPNRYIPRTLELCEDLPKEAKQGPRIDKPIDPPRLLIDDDHGNSRLWHRLDDRYALPESVVSLLIRNAAVGHVKSAVDDTNGRATWEPSVTATVHASLLSAMFREAMAQETYDADLAGLSWSLSLQTSGIRVKCDGFSDRLPDLVVTILEAFCRGDFVQSSYLEACKDRLIRNLSTYFESRRADSIASYYQDFVLSGTDPGLEASIEAAKAATLESTMQHFQTILAHDETCLDCLFTGNVSEQQARDFWTVAVKTLRQHMPAPTKPAAEIFKPGTAERRLIPGHDLELHFASENPKEENGAVLMAYQSSIPAFRGPGLSSDESLKSSSAIRLLSQILREPLFDELRTKQTLGYIVSSYYDVGVSVISGSARHVPVDFLMLCVLSRQVDPPEVAKRMEDFLVDFRRTIESMPESEIEHHATALSTKMLKPIQKLGTEASSHFTRITRYANEVLEQGGTDQDIPWDNAPAVAEAIRALDRQALLDAWDRLVLPKNRSRIVSCVYGSTFPLQPNSIRDKGWRSWLGQGEKTVVMNDQEALVKLRQQLPVFDNRRAVASQSYRISPWWQSFSLLPRTTAGAWTRMAVLAAGWTLWTTTRSKKHLR